MRVAVIGGGAVGLAAIKNCLDENVECTAFEQTGKIGGTWNYSEDTVDENGFPAHSSMYSGLITNLPTALMEYNGFPYEESKQAFVSQPEVLEYIHQFADHFNLLPYVKLFHKVELVDPNTEDKWTIQVRNLKTNEVVTDTYDGVLICNGHYFDPFFPSIQGMEYFTDKSVHSHDYRKADKYKGKRVLVIGGGPSGSDIAKIVARVADKVYYSFRKKIPFGNTIPEKAIPKKGIARLEQNSVVFLDGTQEEIDEIIYCTGYNNSFPFLSENCQIILDENYIHPLYKHSINIEHPSMAIINIVKVVCPFPLCELQIRFYLALLKGRFHASKKEMYEDLAKDRAAHDERGFSNRLAHFIGPNQLEFSEDLAKIAKIRRLPPVIGYMLKYIIANHTPRNCDYKVINDEKFEIVPLS